MKEKEKTVYYCDHCKKHGLVRHAMIKHELICHANPANKRPCFGCVHLVNESVCLDENTLAVSVLYCDKKEIFVHPPQCDIRGNAFDLVDYINHPMPLECEDRRRDG